MKSVARLIHSPDVAILLLRLMLGVVGFYHGGQKLFGLFGGPGIKGFAGYLQGLNVPAATVAAAVSGCAEFFGGIAIAIGLGTRVGALFFAINMGVAIALVHRGAFDARNSGMEYPLTLAVVAVSLVLSGPGRWSLSAMGGSRRGTPG